ncbi:hypothetical protein OEIGOIKO_05806 [Streptomyces chrestomyceticus JCM 4735]|uniref:Uncharacterized protein n=2 Tax=Streptomyces chrestomyceticus TaxID=68185 RepID=A0A7U9L011_9ACTN|nr:hypothetical protein OEIGOIKO_05806 [Streptomyces chrestomyceticus JCM 4735]
MIRDLRARGAGEHEIKVETLRAAARVCRERAAARPDGPDQRLASWYDEVADRPEGHGGLKADEAVALAGARKTLGLPCDFGHEPPDLTPRILTDDDLDALGRFLDDAEEPHLMMTAGEARVAVALLAHYGLGDDKAAALARRWSADVARDLATEGL